MSNITPTSYWLIPDKIIVSAYPDPREKYQYDTKLYKVVNNIVCLMEEFEFKTLNDYRPNIPASINFLHYPIQDLSTLEDDRIMKIIHAINKLKGITMIHCMGGHGRSGVIACLLLHQHTNKKPKECLDELNTLQDTREIKGMRMKTGYQTPQTKQQINQVMRLME